MNFLSLRFFIFFFLFQLLYYIFPKRGQIVLLLGANYVFYLWGNPVMGLYLAGCTLLAYLCALAIGRGKHPKLWLAVSMVCCFGVLFWFKYNGFFSALLGNLAQGLAQPLGLSFYSFALVGYVFDVYRGKIQPERNPICFFAFASFFPSLLSGPINRAGDLIPQIKAVKRFDPICWKAGLWRFLKGAAKKLLVAGMLGSVIDTVYADPGSYSSGIWIMTAVAYSLYIYADFSSYSDMAIGSAQMLGIRLAENFRAPYLSRDVKTFWKKWHISLTSWFREFLYFPLGGSRKGLWRGRLNVIIVFAVSGIWHGSGWSFLIWGLLNGLFQVAGSITLPARQRLRQAMGIQPTNKLWMLWQGLVTFGLITITWIFFRSDSLEEAVYICKRILLVFRDGPGPMPLLLSIRKLAVLVPALAAILAEDIFISTNKTWTIARTTLRFWICCLILLAVILIFGTYGPGFQAQDFVYFKF